MGMIMINKRELSKEIKRLKEELSAIDDKNRKICKLEDKINERIGKLHEEIHNFYKDLLHMFLEYGLDYQECLHLVMATSAILLRLLISAEDDAIAVVQKSAVETIKEVLRDKESKQRSYG